MSDSAQTARRLLEDEGYARELIGNTAYQEPIKVVVLLDKASRSVLQAGAFSDERTLERFLFDYYWFNSRDTNPEEEESPPPEQESPSRVRAWFSASRIDIVVIDSETNPVYSYDKWWNENRKHFK